MKAPKKGLFVKIIHYQMIIWQYKLFSFRDVDLAALQSLVTNLLDMMELQN